MFQNKLYPHQKKALIEALAWMNTLIAQDVDVDTQAVDTIKSMLGIGGTISDRMSKAIESGTTNERKIA